MSVRSARRHEKVLGALVVCQSSCMLACRAVVSVWGSKVLGNRLWRCESGAALLEQALLICLITLALLGVVIAIASWANGMWDSFLR